MCLGACSMVIVDIRLCSEILGEFRWLQKSLVHDYFCRCRVEENLCPEISCINLLRLYYCQAWKKNYLNLIGRLYGH